MKARFSFKTISTAIIVVSVIQPFPARAATHDAMYYPKSQGHFNEWNQNLTSTEKLSMIDEEPCQTNPQLADSFYASSTSQKQTAGLDIFSLLLPTYIPSGSTITKIEIIPCMQLRDRSPEYFRVMYRYSYNSGGQEYVSQQQSGQYMVSSPGIQEYTATTFNVNLPRNGANYFDIGVVSGTGRPRIHGIRAKVTWTEI